MLWRLNHELFPDPGSPIAKTTTPFGGRELALGAATWGVEAAWLGISLVAALDAAPSATAGRGSLPRPRPLPPRPLRRRFFCAESPPTEGTFAWLDPMSLFPCSGSGDSEASISLGRFIRGCGNGIAISRAFAPRRNRLVVKELFQVPRLRPWGQPFCGASSARASISACKPCNTMRYPRTIWRNLPR